MTVLIEAVGLQKQFGDIKAVGGISMRVTKGEVLGFLGPNGAGKSTTMKMITGFLEPDSGLAQAILHDPPVLIMDEPTDGLDPNQKHHVRQLITDMAADKAIIISTHILEEVEAVCSRAVANKGVIVADGTADDLMQRMHYHGAVSLKVVADRADAAIRALSNASTVARVETVRKPNGYLLLRAIPRQKTMSAAEVAAVLRAQNIPVDELYVERGRLDEVFRQITMPDDDGGHDA